MSPAPIQRFRHTARGVVFKLPAEERHLLVLTLEQFRQLLFRGSDPHLACLEPLACLDDPLTELEYRAMAANQLLKHRLEAIETVENGLRTAKGTLNPDAVSAWLQTLNGLRIYLSERLDLHGASEYPGGPPKARGDDDEQEHFASRGEIASGEHGAVHDDDAAQTQTANRRPRRNRPSGQQPESKARSLRSQQAADAADAAGSVFGQPHENLMVIYAWLGLLLEQLVAAAAQDL